MLGSKKWNLAWLCFALGELWGHLGHGVSLQHMMFSQMATLAGFMLAELLFGRDEPDKVPPETGIKRGKKVPFPIDFRNRSN